MLEFSFSLDNSGKILTVREAVAIDSKTKDRMLVAIKHNSDGTFEATTRKYPVLKGVGVGLKGALASFNKAYEVMKTTPPPPPPTDPTTPPIA